MEATEYVIQHAESVETCLTAAVNATINSCADNPLFSIAIHLLTGETPRELDAKGHGVLLTQIQAITEQLKGSPGPDHKSQPSHSIPTLGPQVERSLGYSKWVAHQNSLRKVADSDALPKVFSNLAGNDGQLAYKEFVTALVDRLKLDLSEDEISRVWSRIVFKSQWQAKHGSFNTKDATITFEEFRVGVKSVSFLRLMCNQLMQDTGSMTVPHDYDYSKSTNDNYGVPFCGNGALEFYGKYANIRSKLDYGYHPNYTRDRQAWQDVAVDSVVSRTTPNANPWIVYTCGPMGAGKGYVLSWMSANGYFPLEDIVHIDPDHFKKIMPEWNEYTLRASAPGGQPAGNMCHRESGFLQEIAQEVAMRARQVGVAPPGLAGASLSIISWQNISLVPALA